MTILCGQFKMIFYHNGDFIMCKIVFDNVIKFENYCFVVNDENKPDDENFKMIVSDFDNQFDEIHVTVLTENNKIFDLCYTIDGELTYWAEH